MANKNDVTYKNCRKCGGEFTSAISQGKTWMKKTDSTKQEWTVVVDGYCFNCCSDLAKTATTEFNEFLDKYPNELREAFEKYEYFRKLRTSAIILDWIPQLRLGFFIPKNF